MTKHIEWQNIIDDCYVINEEYNGDEFIGFDYEYFNPINNIKSNWKKFKGLCESCADLTQVQKPIRNIFDLQYLEYIEDRVTTRKFNLWYNYKYAQNDYISLDSNFEDKISYRLEVLEWRIAKQMITVKYPNGINNYIDNNIRGYLIAKDAFLKKIVTNLSTPRKLKKDLEYLSKNLMVDDDNNYLTADGSYAIYDTLGQIWEYSRLEVYPDNYMQYLMLLNWLRDKGYIKHITKK